MTQAYESELRAYIDSVRVNGQTFNRAPWSGAHNGGRKAEASTSVDVYMGETGIYAPAGMPDGADKRDRVPSGWSSAWARQNSTRAGKSERRSVYVGSAKGAVRGQTIDTKQLYKGII